MQCCIGNKQPLIGLQHCFLTKLAPDLALRSDAWCFRWPLLPAVQPCSCSVPPYPCRRPEQVTEEALRQKLEGERVVVVPAGKGRMRIFTGAIPRCERLAAHPSWTVYGNSDMYCGSASGEAEVASPRRVCAAGAAAAEPAPPVQGTKRTTPACPGKRTLRSARADEESNEPAPKRKRVLRSAATVPAAYEARGAAVATASTPPPPLARPTTRRRSCAAKHTDNAGSSKVGTAPPPPSAGPRKLMKWARHAVTGSEWRRRTDELHKRFLRPIKGNLPFDSALQHEVNAGQRATSAAAAAIFINAGAEGSGCSSGDSDAEAHGDASGCGWAALEVLQHDTARTLLVRAKAGAILSAPLLLLLVLQ